MFRAWLLLLLLPAVICIQQADVGTVDWHHSLLGYPLDPGFVYIPQHDLAVTVTQNSIVGALFVGNGSTAWRYFPTHPTINTWDFNADTNELVVVDSERVYVISAVTGVLIQSTLLSNSPSTPSQVKLLSDGSVVLGGETGAGVIRTGGVVEWTMNGNIERILQPTPESLYSLVSTGGKQHSLSLSSIPHPTSKTTTETEVTTIPNSNFLSSVGIISLNRDDAIIWINADRPMQLYYLSLPLPLGTKKASPVLIKLPHAYSTIHSFSGGENVLVGTREGGMDMITLDIHQTSAKVDNLPLDYIPVFGHGSKSPTLRALVSPTTSEIIFAGGVRFPFAPSITTTVVSATLLQNTSESNNSILLSLSDGSLSLFNPSEKIWDRQEDYMDTPAPLFITLPEAPSSISYPHHQHKESYFDRIGRHVLGGIRALSSSLSVSLGAEPAPTAVQGLYKDAFSFRQLIIRTTSTLWVIGIDGASGGVVWRTRLVDARVVHSMVVMDSSSDDDEGDVVVIVVDGLDDGLVLIYKLNPLTGSITHTTPIADKSYIQSTHVLHPSPQNEIPNKLMIIVHQESDTTQTAEGGRQISIYPLCSKPGCISPSSPSSPSSLASSSPQTSISIPIIDNDHLGIRGYALIPSHDIGKWVLEERWRFIPPAGEDEDEDTIVEMRGISDNAGDKSASPASSYGKVIPLSGGGRDVLYKYLNPRIVWVLLAPSPSSPSPSSPPPSTKSTTSGGKSRLVLLDASKGTTLYSIDIPSPQDVSEVKVEMVENWLVYVYQVDGDDDEGGKEWRVGSVEIFEGGMGVRVDSSDSSSSNHAIHTNLTTYQQTYILPHWIGGVTAVKCSVTKRGVAARDLIISTKSNHILNIPYKLLNPRRHGPKGVKPTAQEQEEGLLIPYDPILIRDNSVKGGEGGARKVMSHLYQVSGITKISTHHTLLESTSLVFAYGGGGGIGGGGDMYLGRVMPSGGFDRLSEGFNKGQLILTILALTIGIVVVRPIVMRKKLREVWY